MSAFSSIARAILAIVRWLLGLKDPISEVVRLQNAIDNVRKEIIDERDRLPENHNEAADFSYPGHLARMQELYIKQRWLCEQLEELRASLDK